MYWQYQGCVLVERNSHCLNLPEKYTGLDQSDTRGHHGERMTFLITEHLFSSAHCVCVCGEGVNPAYLLLCCFVARSGVYLWEIWVGDVSRQQSLQRRRADPDPTGNRFFWGNSPIVLRQRECVECVYHVGWLMSAFHTTKEIDFFFKCQKTCVWNFSRWYFWWYIFARKAVMCILYMQMSSVGRDMTKKCTYGNNQTEIDTTL